MGLATLSRRPLLSTHSRHGTIWPFRSWLHHFSFARRRYERQTCSIVHYCNTVVDMDMVIFYGQMGERIHKNGRVLMKKWCVQGQRHGRHHLESQPSDDDDKSLSS